MTSANGNILRPTESLSELHYLIVDDDDTFLDVCETLLKSLGAKLITRARDGAGAYDLLTRRDRGAERVVDCILCDYSMKNGNGLQLLKAIRTGQVKNFRPDACFIIVTATADTNIVAMAAQLDVTGCLVKPLEIERFKATIEKARKRYFMVNSTRYLRVIVPEA